MKRKKGWETTKRKNPKLTKLVLGFWDNQLKMLDGNKEKYRDIFRYWEFSGIRQIWCMFCIISEIDLLCILMHFYAIRDE